MYNDPGRRGARWPSPIADANAKSDGPDAQASAAVGRPRHCSLMGMRIVSGGVPISLGFAAACTAVLLYSATATEDSALGIPQTRFAAVSGTYWLKFPVEALLRTLLFPLAHEDLTHLTNNLSLWLLLAPGLERRWGSLRFAVIMLLTTAAVAGAHAVVACETCGLIGASGLVFACISMSAGGDAPRRRTDTQQREVPAAFVLVVLLYSAREVSGWLSDDSGKVSRISHILGGAIGAVVAMSSWRWLAPQRMLLEQAARDDPATRRRLD